MRLAVTKLVVFAVAWFMAGGAVALVLEDSVDVSTIVSEGSRHAFTISIDGEATCISARISVNAETLEPAELYIGYSAHGEDVIVDRVGIDKSGECVFDFTLGVREAIDSGEQALSCFIGVVGIAKSRVLGQLVSENDPVAMRVLYGYEIGGEVPGSESNGGSNQIPPGESVSRSHGVTVSVSPNPFNPTVRLMVTSERSGYCTIGIYNLQGAEIRNLFGGHLAVGQRAFEWDGRDGTGRQLSSGVYFYKVIIGTDQKSGKLVLLK